MNLIQQLSEGKIALAHSKNVKLSRELNKVLKAAFIDASIATGDAPYYFKIAGSQPDWTSGGSTNLPCYPLSDFLAELKPKKTLLQQLQNGEVILRFDEQLESKVELQAFLDYAFPKDLYKTVGHNYYVVNPNKACEWIISFRNSKNLPEVPLKDFIAEWKPKSLLEQLAAGEIGVSYELNRSTTSNHLKDLIRLLKFVFPNDPTTTSGGYPIYGIHSNCLGHWEPYTLKQWTLPAAPLADFVKELNQIQNKTDMNSQLADKCANATVKSIFQQLADGEISLYFLAKQTNWTILKVF